MRVLLADDHDLVCDGFRAVIERHSPEAQVQTVKTLDDALELAQRESKFDLILLDLNMPGMRGVEGLKRMIEIAQDCPVAIITGMSSRNAVTSALGAGARGFIPKTLTGQRLMAAINLLVEGEIYAPAELLTERRGGDAQDNGYAGLESLTPREMEVAALVVKGAANKEIARALDLQEVTVKLHVRNLCRKLDAKNRTQIAVRLAQFSQFQ